MDTAIKSSQLENVSSVHLERVKGITTVLDILKEHAEHPSALLATNRDTQHFSTHKGLVAYRPAGKKFLVTVAGIAAAAEDRAAVLDCFLDWAAASKRKVIAVQLMRQDAELFATRGFRVNQVGASYSLSLPKHTFAGTAFMSLRNKISRARRMNIQVQEIGVEQPVDATLVERLAAIDQSWLNAKGSHTKELDFLVGEVGNLKHLDRQLRRIFVAKQDDQVIAYILYTATFGSTQGWMHDLSRRTQDAPVGVMELINHTAMQIFKAEGVQFLHFGFTPLTSLDANHEIATACSPMAAKVFRFLAKHGKAIYPATSQLQYKLKWAPTMIQPEYIAFQGGFQLTRPVELSAFDQGHLICNLI